MNYKEELYNLIDNGTIQEYIILQRNLCTYKQDHIYISNKLKEFLNKPIKYKNEIIKQFNNLNNRKYRCYKRIKKIVDNYKYWYFITITINEENINKSEENIERKIKETLNKYFDNWIYNIDLGEENERLHYHGVVGTNESFKYIDVIKDYGLGAIKFSKYNNNIKAINKYINKLTSHRILKNQQIEK